MNDERSLLSEALLDMSSQLTRAQDENERLRVALRELALEAESFAIIARYQGTPLTVLESAIEKARDAAPVMPAVRTTPDATLWRGFWRIQEGP